MRGVMFLWTTHHLTSSEYCLQQFVILPYYRGDSTQISIFEKNEKLKVDFKGSVFHPMAFDILKLS